MSLQHVRVWVIGNRGMLGQDLCQLLEKKGVPYIGSDLEVSILDPDALRKFGQEHLSSHALLSAATTPAEATSFLPSRPWIVNCAAYTAVDKAEDEPEKCFALNAEGPRNIARIAEELGAGLIHISTDYVFDGRGISIEMDTSIPGSSRKGTVDDKSAGTAVRESIKRTGGAGDGECVFRAGGAGPKSGNGKGGVPGTNGGALSTGLRPYREEDPVNPIGVYGKSKAAGETAVLESCSRAVILRTAWLYGKYGNNFVFTMLRLMKEREAVRVVHDQRGTPTWAFDLANALYHILITPDPRYGIFHFTNEGECTWYEFAREIYQKGTEIGLLSKECRIEPIPTAEYPTRARRPQYSVLSKEKIKRVYGVPVPPWQTSLQQFLLLLK